MMQEVAVGAIPGRGNGKSFRALGASDFCLGKSHQSRRRHRRAGAAAPLRFPALLASRGTAPQLASLKQGCLFGPGLLRCSARSKALNIDGNGNGNGNGKSSSDVNITFPGKDAAIAWLLTLIFLRLRASRAPQPGTAVEARVSERSEFARRAVSGEERRVPGRRPGSRRRQRFCFLLPRQKEVAQRAKAFDLFFGAASQVRKSHTP